VFAAVSRTGGVAVVTVDLAEARSADRGSRRSVMAWRRTRCARRHAIRAYLATNRRPTSPAIGSFFL
jgi:hypothetical protein